MRIIRLRARDIRRYRDLDVNLAPGLTIVRGPNEAGKSTIQRILELALTRKVTSTAADLDALRPWDADERSRPFIGLEFIAEDVDVTRTGSLEKSFRGARGSVVLRLDGESVTDPALADERLAELTGIPSEAFFRSTASVRHHEVDGLARDEAALHERLQTSISGGDAGTAAAKKKLEKALRDLTSKGDKNPGRVKTAEQQLDALRLSVQAGEARLAQLEADRERLSLAREARTIAESTLAEQRSLLEKARQAERIVADRGAAQERYERYREAVARRDELAALEASHPWDRPIGELTAAVERVRAAASRLGAIVGMIENEVEVEFELPAEPSWRPLLRFGLIALAAGGLVAAIALGGLAALVWVDEALYVGLLAGAVALGGLVATLIGLWLRHAANRGVELRDFEIDRRLRGRSQLDLDRSASDKELEAALAAVGVPDLAAADALLAAETAHLTAIERAGATLTGLIGDEQRDGLATKRDEAALVVERATSALDELGPIATDARARERLEVEVRESEAALEEARDAEATARAQVEANTVDADQVAGEAERLAVWGDQLATLQRRVRILELTLSAIEAAERTTMTTATQYLERTMVDDLERVTNGRYRRVRIDERTLDIEVWAPERGDWVDAHQLSQGTLDVVYLVARLGLVRLVTGDRRPPLVFDDPFVTFDDERAARTMALLKRLTSDFQVIYLTMSSRYDEIADAVIELPPPIAHDGHPEDGLTALEAAGESGAGPTSSGA